MKPSPQLSLLEALAHGLIDPPAGDDHPARERWQWFADLYSDRTWGLVAAVDGFPRMVADQIAAACRDTADRTATIEQWKAVKDVAITARSAAQSESLELAWSAVIDTCTDALDHLAGYTFGGLEAILGALDAIQHEHTHEAAMSLVNDAYTAWEKRRIQHLLGDRSVA